MEIIPWAILAMFSTSRYLGLSEGSIATPLLQRPLTPSSASPTLRSTLSVALFTLSTDVHSHKLVESSLMKLLPYFNLKRIFFLLKVFLLPTSSTFSLMLATLRIECLILRPNLSSIRSHSPDLSCPMFTALPRLQTWRWNLEVFQNFLINFTWYNFWMFCFSTIHIHIHTCCWCQNVRMIF